MTPSSPTTSSKGPPTFAHFLVLSESPVCAFCWLFPAPAPVVSGECAVQGSEAGLSTWVRVASGQQGELTSHEPGPRLRRAGCC